MRDFLIKIAGINEKYLKYLDITVKGKKYALDKKLKNNMNIHILLPIGGG